MRAIFWFDDFLIDRVCQPIADRLGLSCYAIAAFLFTGAILADLAAAVRFGSVLPGMVALMFVGDLVLVHHMDASAPSNVMPLYRLRHRPVRWLFPALSLCGWTSHLVTGLRLGDVLDNGGWTLATLGIYFAACRKTPPMRQVRAPRGRLASQMVP